MKKKLSEYQLYKRAYEWNSLKEMIVTKERAMKLQVKETDILRRENNEIKKKLRNLNQAKEIAVQINMILDVASKKEIEAGLKSTISKRVRECIKLLSNSKL